MAQINSQHLLPVRKKNPKIVLAGTEGARPQGNAPGPGTISDCCPFAGYGADGSRAILLSGKCSARAHNPGLSGAIPGSATRPL